ncbi:hypothetical protein EDC04DRAFT_2606614 [Pisolithus marmoratus]|nr:hypothetical protein EDC04DRAFT_2606614 [Pisolithus marmoratus]
MLRHASPNTGQDISSRNLTYLASASSQPAYPTTPSYPSSAAASGLPFHKECPPPAPSPPSTPIFKDFSAPPVLIHLTPPNPSNPVTILICGNPDLKKGDEHRYTQGYGIMWVWKCSNLVHIVTLNQIQFTPEAKAKEGMEFFIWSSSITFMWSVNLGMHLAPLGREHLWEGRRLPQWSKKICKHFYSVTHCFKVQTTCENVYKLHPMTHRKSPCYGYRHPKIWTHLRGSMKGKAIDQHTSEMAKHWQIAKETQCVQRQFNNCLYELLQETEYQQVAEVGESSDKESTGIETSDRETDKDTEGEEAPESDLEVFLSCFVFVWFMSLHGGTILRRRPGATSTGALTKRVIHRGTIPHLSTKPMRYSGGWHRGLEVLEEGDSGDVNRSLKYQKGTEVKS